LSDLKLYAEYGNSSPVLGISLSASPTYANVAMPGNLTAATIQAGNGFTGTGSYTNFSIVGGVITAAA
jgi:hypothetical protein